MNLIKFLAVDRKSDADTSTGSVDEAPVGG